MKTTVVSFVFLVTLYGACHVHLISGACAEKISIASLLEEGDKLLLQIIQRGTVRYLPEYYPPARKLKNEIIPPLHKCLSNQTLRVKTRARVQEFLEKAAPFISSASPCTPRKGKSHSACSSPLSSPHPPRALSLSSSGLLTPQTPDTLSDKPS